MKVQLNELLAIKNITAGEERHARVVQVSEERANQNKVAIELQSPRHAFPILIFAPADWKTLDD